MKTFRLLLIGVFAASAAARADEKPLSAELSLKVESPQSAACPITAELIITNTGKRSFYYWCGGPDFFPSAHLFRATINVEGQAKRELQLSNGQYQAGSGTDTDIAPDKQQRVPIAFGRLKPGSYTISVRSPERWQNIDGESIVYWPEMPPTVPFHIVVTDDPAVTERHVQSLLEDVRIGSEFAIHAASHYPSPTLHEALAPDLLADDPQFVLGAARALASESQPHKLGETVSRAIAGRLAWHERYRVRRDTIFEPGQRNEDAKSAGVNRWAIIFLAELAEHLATDEALEGIFELKMAEDYDRIVIDSLAKFPQPAAREALIEYMSHREKRKRNQAAYNLVRYRKDPAGLPIVLEAARRDDQQSAAAIFALGYLPYNEEVEQVLRQAMKSDIESRRSAAGWALAQMMEEKS